MLVNVLTSPTHPFDHPLQKLKTENKNKIDPESTPCTKYELRMHVRSYAKNMFQDTFEYNLERIKRYE